LYSHKEEGWELSIDEMMDLVKAYDGKPITEVHIVGGVHPKMDIHFFAELMKKSKRTDRIYISKVSLQWNWIICSEKPNSAERKA